MHQLLFTLLSVAIISASLSGAPQKKKSEKEVTQTLDLPPDPPPSVTVETARLEYIVSPLSGKGLLSQQVRDGLKALRQQAGSRQILKLRAFVAGTGDQRRVQSIVSETFNDRKQPIPALVTALVGLLPLDGAQVVLEAAVVNKKPVNPNGLGFLSGMGGFGTDGPEKVMPMLEKAIGDLNHAAAAAGSQPSDFLRVTCLLSSLDQVSDVRSRLASAYPSAVFTTVQVQRAHDKSLAECEAVVRLRKKPSEALVMLNPPEMNPSPNYSKAALIGSERLVLTGSQMAFHNTEEDIRLAFQRIAKVLEDAKSSTKHVAFSSFYPLSNALVERIRGIRFEFWDKARPPAATMLVFEGLPSMDASFAFDLVAVPAP